MLELLAEVLLYRVGLVDVEVGLWCLVPRGCLAFLACLVSPFGLLLEVGLLDAGEKSRPLK